MGLLEDTTEIVATSYAINLAVAALVYGYLVDKPGYYVASVILFAGAFVVPIRYLISLLGEPIVGIKHVVAGIVLFIVALVISLTKMQVWLYFTGRQGPPSPPGPGRIGGR